MTDVSEEELQVAFSGPALFSNIFYVTSVTGGVRIAFMEGHEDEGVLPVFRSAVMLSHQDAIALWDLLSVTGCPIPS